MAAINRSLEARQLVPGLNKVLGLAYGNIDNEHLPLYSIETSDRSFEEEVMFSLFGTAPVKDEGAAISYDTAQESWVARYNHETIALGFAVTEEAMEDNLYDTFAKVRAKGLGRAMANTKQVKAVVPFNNGFTTFLTGDGVPLFSASHPTLAAGLQSNVAAVDLSETGLENATIAIGLYKDDRNILIGANPRSLHIPTQLQFTAHRILRSNLRVGTADNDTNALKDKGIYSGGAIVNHRFTDTNAWYIRTDVENGMKMFVRVPLSSKMEGDFDTGNMRYKSRERYSFGASDWRGVYGSSGST